MLPILSAAQISHAQEEDRVSSTIQIEAEIVQGNATSGGFLGSTAGASTTSGATLMSGTSGQTTPATSQQGQQQQQTPTRTQPTQQQAFETVAGELLRNAQTGALSVADTAMVNALQAGAIGQNQNLDALISFAFVGGAGDVVSKSTSSSEVPLDVLGIVAAGESPDGTAQGGAVPRGSDGPTYFVVQVCTCSL